ncbi:MAG: transposase [Gammaproteobacteria bacterium]
MARPLRIEFPGALYHITSRGNARQAIVANDGDRTLFLTVLGCVISRFHLCLYAYCLMDNHYHLLMETPEGNLSRALRQLNGVYTQAFNRRHRKIGHVLQGRFKAILVERESYLLELCRYVVLNPVRVKSTRTPDLYPWSSYRATAGLDPRPPWLCTDWLLSQFSAQRASARRRYQAFVTAGIGQASPWERLKAQILLGSDAYVQRLKPKLQGKQTYKGIPKPQRFAARPSLARLFTAKVLADLGRRNAVIRQAHLAHAYSQSQISRVLNLHYSTISRVVNRNEEPETDARGKI